MNCLARLSAVFIMLYAAMNISAMANHVQWPRQFYNTSAFRAENAFSGEDSKAFYA